MRAVTIGSATFDVIGTIGDADIEQMTLRNRTASFLLMEPGRKIDAKSIVSSTGGGAVNTAVSLKRQGFDVGTILIVGDDQNGQTILSLLEGEGISTESIRIHESEPTATSVIISSHDHNAAIFTYRGANCCLKDDDLSEACFENADLVYVANLSNQSADQFGGMIERARRKGAFVAVNPGIRQMSFRTAPFLESLRYVDIVALNVGEASVLVPHLAELSSGQENSFAGLERMGPMLAKDGIVLSAKDYMARMHTLGPRYVLLTNGNDGAYILGDGDFTINRESVRKSAARSEPKMPSRRRS